MTTFEKCQTIQRMLTNCAGACVVYTNWSDEFVARQLRELPRDILEEDAEFGQIQPAELTYAECNSLGFGRWTKNSPLRLIPLWLFPFLAEEIRTTCINGSKCLCKADMDTDSRFGCLAYGIIPVDGTIEALDDHHNDKGNAADAFTFQS